MSQKNNKEEAAKDAAKEVASGVEEEVKRIRSAAESAREEAGHDEGETEKEYNERVANVPGIFGDIDTTAGVGAGQMDIPSRNNEEATVAAAEVESAKQLGDDDDDVQDASHDQARRQVDVAADGQPSAEEVEEGAPDEEKTTKVEAEVPSSKVRNTSDRKPTSRR